MVAVAANGLQVARALCIGNPMVWWECAARTAAIHGTAICAVHLPPWLCCCANPRRSSDMQLADPLQTVDSLRVLWMPATGTQLSNLGFQSAHRGARLSPWDLPPGL